MRPGETCIASRGLGRWHWRTGPNGKHRFYRYVKRLGYCRVPKFATPWRGKEIV